MEAAINENRKRKGTLKVSLSGFTISLVAFIIALISIILGTQMIKAQNRTLAKGLHDRVDVLLSSLVTGTRSYLPSGDVLELSQLPRQMNSLSEAQFVTITALPDMERNAKNSKSLLHIWASNDENIKNKVDVLNARKTSFDPGVSELVKNIENETEGEIMRGIVFAVITLIVACLIAYGLEWVAALLAGSLQATLVRVYAVGIHPLSLHINICGILGLILGYLIVVKFVRK